MFPQSIRWRLQLWLAILLVCVLTGFGITIYQLHRISQLREIDEELERRVAVLSGAVRGGPPRPGFGPPKFESGPGPMTSIRIGDLRRHRWASRSRRHFAANERDPSDLAILRFRLRSQASLTQPARKPSISRSGPAMARCSNAQATRLPTCRALSGSTTPTLEPTREPGTDTVKPFTLRSLPTCTCRALYQH